MSALPERSTTVRANCSSICGLPGEGVLSTQVLQELCINLRRKVARPLPVEEVRQLIQDYLSWEVIVSKPDSVLQALEIEMRYEVSSGTL